jgi:hypothetical protein
LGYQGLNFQVWDIKDSNFKDRDIKDSIYKDCISRIQFQGSGYQGFDLQGLDSKDSHLKDWDSKDSISRLGSQGLDIKDSQLKDWDIKDSILRIGTYIKDGLAKGSVRSCETLRQMQESTQEIGKGPRSRRQEVRTYVCKADHLGRHLEWSDRINRVEVAVST